MDKADKRIAHRSRGGQPGNRNARKHGRRTAEAQAFNRYVRELLRASRATLATMQAPERCRPQMRTGDDCDMQAGQYGALQKRRNSPLLSQFSVEFADFLLDFAAFRRSRGHTLDTLVR
jgi:hypothetical protein